MIITYSPKMQLHKNSCKHSCSGKTYQAHNSAYGSPTSPEITVVHAS